MSVIALVFLANWFWVEERGLLSRRFAQLVCFWTICLGLVFMIHGIIICMDSALKGPPPTPEEKRLGLIIAYAGRGPVGARGRRRYVLQPWSGSIRKPVIPELDELPVPTKRRQDGRLIRRTRPEAGGSHGLGSPDDPEQDPYRPRRGIVPYEDPARAPRRSRRGEDAVTAELDLARDLGDAFVTRWGLFRGRDAGRLEQDYLLRPDLGRSLSESAAAVIRERCPARADFQVVIGDGLSAAAVIGRCPRCFLDCRSRRSCAARPSVEPFFLRHCRGGELNDLGELLDPPVNVLLIGERPGPATAESLSAYMGFRPRHGDDDSRRNLISNIHARGVSSDVAARRIALLAEEMIRLQMSGVSLKEGAQTIGAPASRPRSRIKPRDHEVALREGEFTSLKRKRRKIMI